MKRYDIQVKAQLLLEYVLTDDSLRNIAFRNNSNPEITLPAVNTPAVIDYIIGNISHDGEFTGKDFVDLYGIKVREMQTRSRQTWRKASSPYRTND
ncbi:MAG: hypothetical protein HY364_04160 [Candidatus Aenigmarchaeota archaeon]|nr:hypothetical protein [Candidatus Aenigmarchaeota archaeon]